MASALDVWKANNPQYQNQKWDGYVSPSEVPQYIQNSGIKETSSSKTPASNNGINGADMYLSLLENLQSQKNEQVQAAYMQGKSNLDSARKNGLSYK